MTEKIENRLTPEERHIRMIRFESASGHSEGCCDPGIAEQVTSGETGGYISYEQTAEGTEVRFVDD